MQVTPSECKFIYFTRFLSLRPQMRTEPSLWPEKIKFPDSATSVVRIEEEA